MSDTGGSAGRSRFDVWDYNIGSGMELSKSSVDESVSMMENPILKLAITSSDILCNSLVFK